LAEGPVPFLLKKMMMMMVMVMRRRRKYPLTVVPKT
jgi:hypothetical protein